jgi:hypothetical protein
VDGVVLRLIGGLKEGGAALEGRQLGYKATLSLGRLLLRREGHRLDVAVLERLIRLEYLRAAGRPSLLGDVLLQGGPSVHAPGWGSGVDQRRNVLGLERHEGHV